MANIRKSAAELIGGTPLMEVTHYEKNHGITDATLLVKLEYLNPAGSVKDRVALHMIEEAEADGRLQPGATIIEPTSGNTGIGLAAVAAAKGYHALLTLPETMSAERQKLLKAYGARLVLTDGARGMEGAIEKAAELQASMPGSVILGQFVNPANPDAHRKTTGPEIWEDTDGKVDIFVAGVGTGGTITGIGEYLKEKNPDIRVVAVEPAGSPVLSGGAAGKHALQGIGAGFVPEVLNTAVYDEIIPVSDEDAYAAGRSAGGDHVRRGASCGNAFGKAAGESGQDDRGASAGFRGPLSVHAVVCRRISALEERYLGVYRVSLLDKSGYSC